STEKVVKYIHEARGMGITVLPPDVHESGLYFTPVGESIRFGLAAVKNVGENTARAICEARTRTGNFQTFFKFCEGLDTRVLNRRVLESLIKSGALDALGGRSQLIAVVDRALERAQKVTRARGSGQHAMFAGSYEPVDYEALPDAGEWSEEERLAGEYAVLGFYVSGHPLEKYAGRLKELKAVDLGAVEGRRSGEEITVAGIIVSIRPMRSRKGARWAIFTLQDLTGVQELLAFPEACARMEGILKVGTALLIKGRVNIEEAGTRVVVVEAHPLEQMAERAPALMRVRVDLAVVNELTLDRLQELFESKPGNCPVAFELLSADGSKATLQAQQCVRADQALVDAISAVCGADAVEVVR
ncbi:MAG TPA: OB-fold nucleic acid binding domain-containing protein, partial [Candidatus Limnocylindria bacterium]|nr:OB-fold nucleic acid binding domain-containing protein [Candidatus Limnocylindria bacterium]